MEKKELDWKTIDQLLGVKSDKKIAAMHNVSASPIRSRRIALGIPAYVMGQERDWASIDSLLTAGVSIKDVSLRFNIYGPTLYDRCRKLGIIRPKPEPLCWPKIDPLLGTEPDAELAREFSISEAVIAKRRKQLGVPACLRWKIIDWSKVDPYLGRYTDREIAEEAGVSEARVGSRRRRLGIPSFSNHLGSIERIDWKAIEPYLGTMPDKQLADKYNVSLSSICRKRLDMGIKAYIPPRNWRKNTHLFNNLSNMQIAKRYRVSTSAAGAARSKLGMTEPKKDLSFIDQYLDVPSDAEIADKFGLDKRSVYNRRYRVTKRKGTSVKAHANDTCSGNMSMV